MVMFVDTFWAGRVEELWNCKKTNFLLNCPGVQQVISRTRYYQLVRYLHFSAENIARADRNNPLYDKIYKVRLFLNHLQTNFQRYYVCERDYALDEGMVPFKGRLGFKQYQKDKPTK